MKFTLEYWQDSEGFMGRLKEVPGVFGQGDSLDALRESIRAQYRELLDREDSPLLDRMDKQETEIEL